MRGSAIERQAIYGADMLRQEDAMPAIWSRYAREGVPSYTMPAMASELWSRYAASGSAIERQARYGADMLREGVLSNARQDMEQICCERECYRAPCRADMLRERVL